VRIDNTLKDMVPPRRVLMVAFHFPPLAGSSGIQRTLRFVQHLPAYGWQPIVLTAHPRAYSSTSDDLLASIAPDVVVERAFALDTARHLAVGGRYPEFLARPDRWVSWMLGAVMTGLRLTHRLRPAVIWSTYPIATAHAIGSRLHRVTGIPLVADFRDPMAQEGYPEDANTHRSFERIERRAVLNAARVVLVTPGAQALYQARYPGVPQERFTLIENGYDEESFIEAERGLERTPLNPGCFTLLHSGIVYPSERDPTALFEALGRMKRDGRVNAHSLRVRFRAPVHGELLVRLAAQSNTSDLVEVLAPVPYALALQEMLRADGLLVMQGANCNEQIPAKLYEYFRAGRPILGLADPAGDTARVMVDAGVDHLALLENADQVEAALTGYLAAVRSGAAAAPPDRPIQDMSRQARARALAGVLEAASASGRCNSLPARTQPPERKPSS
jgi:glycosyltransferase involved in cell wall biosynthesis